MLTLGVLTVYKQSICHASSGLLSIVQWRSVSTMRTGSSLCQQQIRKVTIEQYLHWRRSVLLHEYSVFLTSFSMPIRVKAGGPYFVSTGEVLVSQWTPDQQ